MENITVTQNADFLSIALEELEAGNYETAEGFITEVEQELSSHGEEELSQLLRDSLSLLNDRERGVAIITVEEVYGELIERL
jgi:hypothetical protein